MNSSPHLCSAVHLLQRMTTRYVIGVDGGTESLRAGVFDLTGTPVAMASSSYATSFPQPSWAEQNPEDWWQVRNLKIIVTNNSESFDCSVRMYVQAQLFEPRTLAFHSVWAMPCGKRYKKQTCRQKPSLVSA
jgi:hypothetical protein